MMTENDIVIKTEVRLSRNVKGYPFPVKMDDKRASVIASSVYDAVNISGNYELYNISQLAESKINSLKEKRLITPRLSSSQNGSAIIANDESVSIMINEVDHVTIRSFAYGFDADGAFKIANDIDDSVAAKMQYAYSDKLGFLTSSPSNVGTGLRVSCLLFLPGLHITEAVRECISALSRINISLNPSSKSEHSDGYAYELSTVHTLGVSENDILDKFKAAVKTICSYEEKARENLIAENEVVLKDKIMRSYGIATNCYKMGVSEMFTTLAFVKLGAYYKILPINSVDVIDKLTVSLLPYTMAKNKKDGFKSAEEKEIFRATKIKEALKSL